MEFCPEGSVCLSGRSPSVCLSGSQPISCSHHEPSEPDEGGTGQQPTQVHTHSSLVRERGDFPSRLLCVQRWLVPLRPLQLAAAHQSACRIPLRGNHRLGRDQSLGQPGTTSPPEECAHARGLCSVPGDLLCSLSHRAWVEGSWAPEPPRVGGP